MSNQNRSTGPTTPEGKRRCALNAYRHGLTGQLNILTPDEQQAYDKHSKITLEALTPATDFERDLAQSIADDRWRLKRARTIESGMFALGMQNGAADAVEGAGAPQVDDALAQARTWMREARNLQLLTIYEQRIRRAVDKSMVQLETLQAKRQQAAKDDMHEAKLLYQLAQAEGKPYRPEAFFAAAPQVRESVFSTPEIAREMSRDTLIRDARRYDRDGTLPRKTPITQAPTQAPTQAMTQAAPIGRRPTARDQQPPAA